MISAMQSQLKGDFGAVGAAKDALFAERGQHYAHDQLTKLDREYSAGNLPLTFGVTQLAGRKYNQMKEGISQVAFGMSIEQVGDRIGYGINAMDRQTMDPASYEMKYRRFSADEGYDPKRDPGHVFHALAADALVDPLTYVAIGAEASSLRRAGQLAKGTEIPWAAEEARLAASSGGLRAADSWGRPGTLADHFGRHGADFGAKTAESYARQASKFLQEAQTRGLPTKVGPDGAIRIYDSATNTFGSFNANGTTRTLYKPNPTQHGYPTNIDYWNAQPGGAPWTP
ncbi:MAG TPA: hypothetical protein VGN42_15160 [Pirellulales bacterium]|jgi:hypothetical protein|nr:hypothetical protein [Pirellulales bacterium]